MRSHDSRVRPLGSGDGSVLSLWRWEVVSDRVATPAEVGSLAGRLHRATAGSPGLVELAPADPLGATLKQLSMRPAPPGGAEDPDHALLREVAADLAELEDFGAGAHDAVVVEAQSVDRMLRLRLGAADVEAFGADVVHVGVVDSDVAHGGAAVVVALDQHAGEADPAHLDELDLEVAGAAADRDAAGIPFLDRPVIDHDAVASG